MVYVGHRPVLPGQNSNDLVHPFTGEAGEYSNYSFTISGTQLLEEVGHPDLPDHSEYSTRSRGWQVFTGEFRYAPMELGRYSHGGQNAPYLTDRQRFEFRGVPGAEVFDSGDWGHDGSRVLSTSRHSNLFHYGVPSTDMALTGHGVRYAGEDGVPAGFGRDRPWENQGVTPSPLEDGGENLAHKVGYAEDNDDYAFQRVNEWRGVPSARAL